ncbi:unnamed protein product, partial [Amoebophrya sp. A25]|eukprot:GSA25T00019327001.1
MYVDGICAEEGTTDAQLEAAMGKVFREKQGGTSMLKGLKEELEDRKKLLANSIAAKMPQVEQMRAFEASVFGAMGKALNIVGIEDKGGASSRAVLEGSKDAAGMKNIIPSSTPTAAGTVNPSTIMAASPRTAAMMNPSMLPSQSFLQVDGHGGGGDGGGAGPFASSFSKSSNSHVAPGSSQEQDHQYHAVGFVDASAEGEASSTGGATAETVVDKGAKIDVEDASSSTADAAATSHGAGEQLDPSAAPASSASISSSSSSPTATTATPGSSSGLTPAQEEFFQKEFGVDLASASPETKAELKEVFDPRKGPPSYGKFDDWVESAKARDFPGAHMPPNKAAFLHNAASTFGAPPLSPALAASLGL